MKRYITTAIDYVNSIPHIGTAYEKIGADVLARFYRMRGDDVVLQMGNDEHSANVQKAAAGQKIPPKEYCDRMRPRFEDVWKRLNVVYDQFIQTSEPRHHESVKKFFERVYDKGDIYPRDYEGPYCESCEAFYTDKDLVDGLCPNHKTKPKWLKEKNYFFRLSNYAGFLLDHIQDHPEFILPKKRRNEVVNFIKQGLEDISISRSTFDWGIPLPLDPKHVMYVWFDALINYVTGAGFGSDEKKFAETWPADLHVVGKDITRFHAVIWPAMLQSAGLPLPKTVLGHGFVYLKGEKMSKSLGNVVTPLDILEKYPEFGTDALRYYLMRTSAFGDDSDFTWDDFILRYNSDLANGIGNLVSRTLGMVWKYQGGTVAPAAFPEEECALLARAGAVWEEVRGDLDPHVGGDMHCHFAIEKIWAYVTEIDQYIDRKKPWSLAKDAAKKDELSTVMTTIVEAVRLVCALVFPFIPAAAEKIWKGYGFDRVQDIKTLSEKDFANTSFIAKPHALSEQKLMIFPRIESKPEAGDVVPVKPAKETFPPSKGETPGEGAPLVDIADFSKIDLRVAKILQAERVEKADKLLKLQVEIGTETRQIVAGIAEYYAPETLVGKRIVVVVNLKPAKIRGIESRGMLLAAKAGGKLLIVTPDGEIDSGAKVG
jgi:methionyl-tRNA synthetase